jgi:transketolase
MAEHRINTRLIKIGITQYGGSDSPEALYKKYHLDDEALIKIIKNNL